MQPSPSLPAATLAASELAEPWTPLSRQLRLRACFELREHESTRAMKCAAVRRLLHFYTEISPQRTDSAFLLRFLRARRFDVEEAAALCASYFRFRRQHRSDLFADFSCCDPAVRSALLDCLPSVLDSRDHQGRPLVLLRPGQWDTKRYGAAAVLRATLLTLEKLLESDEVQIAGLLFLVDWTGYRAGRADWLQTTGAVRTLVHCIDSCFPVVVHGVHFIGEPWIVQAALRLCKSLSHLADKVVLHGGNLSSLHRHIAAHLLPSELGGPLPPHDSTRWLGQMCGAGTGCVEADQFAFGDDCIFWPAEKEYRSFSKSVSLPAGIVTAVGSDTRASDSCYRVALDEQLFLE